MNKLGKIFIVIGIILISISSYLLIDNFLEEKHAENSSKEVLEIMEQTTNNIINLSNNSTVSINGDSYIGIIYLPSLNLELPVMTKYSDVNLQKAPCVYYGSIYTNDLIICAHSYKAHFKYLSKLSKNDYIIIKDINNQEYYYQVLFTEVLEPTDVLEMIDNEYDLTLYTCTPDGQKRITIRCNKIISPIEYN